jgi:hypothetical protein
VPYLFLGLVFGLLLLALWKILGRACVLRRVGRVESFQPVFNTGVKGHSVDEGAYRHDAPPISVAELGGVLINVQVAAPLFPGLANPFVQKKYNP